MELKDMDNGMAIAKAVHAYGFYMRQSADDSMRRFMGYPYVLYNSKSKASIILMGEIHESKDEKLWATAKNVAKAVLAIGPLGIGVEEPVEHDGVLVANVGMEGGKGIETWKGSESLFVFAPDSQASIAGQIYVAQIEKGDHKFAPRFAAETEERKYRKLADPVKINKDMVSKLVINSTNDSVVVYPVGDNHLVTHYTQDTLQKLLTDADWEEVDIEDPIEEEWDGKLE
ncbi:hypothetical protein BTJ40_11740 [Microbulbifer sp. A4B17]|uniref:hypothetical protein n=1 Tax=Microbulbifer sp. A4B17 TaxID=359370 RepID=UPI000D52ED65|nr:hypothetical protein [Microbulbifer sp. A4B17]AWF81436.1 hypothetical protein BTJ40_11740 [Microbulbifer sp. A4B17]